MSETAAIRVERPRPGVVLATLDRPERLNALSFPMFHRIGEICAEVEADPEARALVLTGAGRGFCAGLDLDEAETLAAMSASEFLRGQEGWVGGIAAIDALGKPVIAAVNGPAAGAGMALALMADIRVASSAASFATAFVKLGLSAGDVGMSWLLPRLVGLGHASELMLSGEGIDAARAERIGLVNRVVEPEALREEALDLAASIAAHSSFGLRLTKRVLRQNVDAPSLAAAMELENRNQALATRGEEMATALAAFREHQSRR